ncbi:MAG: septation protein IspZ [Polyangiales bacterium]
MLGRIVQIVAALALLVYPFAVYIGLTRWDVRAAAAVLLLLLAPAAIVRLRRQRASEVRAVAFVPVVTVGLLALSALLDSAGFILVVPVFVNLGLLATFGSTLRWGPPMIERFARLQEPDLSTPKVEWCRMWTWIWCGFFSLNAVAAAALAFLAPLEWWTLYNGLIAYGLVALMFAIEFVLRHFKFGRAPAKALPAQPSAGRPRQ